MIGARTSKIEQLQEVIREHCPNIRDHGNPEWMAGYVYEFMDDIEEAMGQSEDIKNIRAAIDFIGELNDQITQFNLVTQRKLNARWTETGMDLALRVKIAAKAGVLINPSPEPTPLQDIQARLGELHNHLEVLLTEPPYLNPTSGKRNYGETAAAVACLRVWTEELRLRYPDLDPEDERCQPRTREHKGYRDDPQSLFMHAIFECFGFEPEKSLGGALNAVAKFGGVEAFTFQKEYFFR